MPKIFLCKTVEAHTIKVASELLANNLKNGCFEITEDSVSLCMWDQTQTTMIDLELLAEKFNIYKFNMKNTKKLCIGLTLNHLHKMLRSIKKKDCLELYIDSECSNKLYIKKIPKENTRIVSSAINIKSIQNIESEKPTGYGKPVIVQSSEFQKMCKDLSFIESPNIRIVSKPFSLDFEASADGIMSTVITLGENYTEEDGIDNQEQTKIGTFSPVSLFKISKISGLSKSMQIYTGSDDLPYLFRSDIESLGKISIYIKSLELIEKHKKNCTEDDEDEDD